MHRYHLGWILVLCSCFEERPKEVISQPEQKEIRRELFRSKDLTDSVFSIGIEGPFYYKGLLYVVNLKQRGNIARVYPDGRAEVFKELAAGRIGNGIRFDSRGRMLVADYKKHNILRIDMDSRNEEVWVHEVRMNQPNDIVVTRNDIIFAADPDWAKSSGKLWRVDADGKTYLVEDHMGTTNGLELSPDERRLYVNESVQRNVWVYDVDMQGKLSNKRLFYRFTDHGMDGMHTDIQGNLYITRYGKGTVAVISPQGKLIREVLLTGKKPTNLAFGGKEGKTVYVTMQDRRRIEYFENDVQGREWVK